MCLCHSVLCTHGKSPRFFYTQLQHDVQRYGKSTLSISVITHSHMWVCIYMTYMHIFYEESLDFLTHKNIRLFCGISSLILGSFAKETYNVKEPTKWKKSRDFSRLQPLSWCGETKEKIYFVYVCDHALTYERKYTSLLQNIISYIGLFCKRDL